MSTTASRGAAFVGLSLLVASPGGSVSRDGAVRFDGVRVGDTITARIESGVLRLEPRAAAAFLARTAVHLFATEGRDAWERDVAPGLADALASGPEAVARIASTLPEAVAVAGPNIDGGVLEFTLPGGAGEGLVAIRFPDLLDRGRSDPALLATAWPNRGLFVSGVDVQGGGDLVGVSVPGRPKGLTRGSPPPVSPKELPGDGLVFFRGRGASGADAEPLRRDLEALRGQGRIDGADLRTFPKGKDDLVRDLKTFRVRADVLDAERGWYDALAEDPQEWRFSEQQITHPVRFIAFSAPVAIEDTAGVQSTVILGGVALYTPLLISAQQAPLYLGTPARDVYAAVHRGEIPFLRDGGAVFFHRAALDRWRRGAWRVAGGATYGSKGAARRVEELADELRSKGIARAARQPLPRRFQPAPADAPEGSPPVRGRVFGDDLAQWLRHYDPRAAPGRAEALFSLTDAAGGARFTAGFGGGGTAPTATGPGLEVFNLYTLDPTCTTGQQVVAALGFVLDGVPDGEEATLLLQWSLASGGQALARFSAEIAREAGEHEVHLEAGCPGQRGTATFEVHVAWPDRALSGSQTTSVVSR